MHGESSADISSHQAGTALQWERGAVSHGLVRAGGAGGEGGGHLSTADEPILTGQPEHAGCATEAADERQQPREGGGTSPGRPLIGSD